MQTHPLDLVIIGNLLLDQFESGEIRAGGAALFAALAAKKAGLKVAVHSVAGLDYPLELLKGVELSLQRLTEPNGRTVIRYIDGVRSLRHEGPGHDVMTPQTACSLEARLFHIAPMPTNSQLFHLQASPDKSALLDPYPYFDQGYLERLLPHRHKLKYLLLNEEELQVDTALIPPDLPTLIKQGSRGGYCLHTGIRWEPQPVKVMDQTGAGDSFIAGLAAGLLSGADLDTCLCRGADLAALAISRTGIEGLI